MNRRNFIGLLLGAAGAPLVPWRGLVEPVIFLPRKPDDREILRMWFEKADWVRENTNTTTVITARMIEEFQRIFDEQSRLTVSTVFGWGRVIIKRDEAAIDRYVSQSRGYPA